MKNTTLCSLVLSRNVVVALEWTVHRLRILPHGPISRHLLLYLSRQEARVLLACRPPTHGTGMLSLMGLLCHQRQSPVILRGLRDAVANMLSAELSFKDYTKRDS